MQGEAKPQQVAVKLPLQLQDFTWPHIEDAVESADDKTLEVTAATGSVTRRDDAKSRGAQLWTYAQEHLGRKMLRFSEEKS